MGKIKITPVTHQFELKQFINLLWKIYQNYSFWIPPLIKECKNILDGQNSPFYKQADLEFFIASLVSEPEAFTFTILDYNFIFKKMNGRLFPIYFIKLFTERMNIEWARILTPGIIPVYPKKGDDALLHRQLLSNGLKMGLKYA
jgi:hypothetical protein